GYQAVRNPLGGYYDTNGNYVAVPIPAGITLLSNYFVGDPEWIGILEYPDRPHSPSNRFVARDCFLVVPASQTLDINYIHNYARMNGTMLLDGFARNQGVGTYEINLGAFLTDLNTNQWDPSQNRYQYFDQNFTIANQGAGFDSAV